MDNSQSEIRRQIEATRSDMAEKISALQERIDGAVVEMKHLVDPKYQVEHRPWLMVGLSLVGGYLTSRWLFSRPKRVVVRRDAQHNSSLVGGLVSAVAMGLARDFASNLLLKRRSQTQAKTAPSAQTTPPRGFH
jgi:Protein of unknown function (DUF3618)